MIWAQLTICALGVLLAIRFGIVCEKFRIEGAGQDFVFVVGLLLCTAICSLALIIPHLT